MLTIINPDNAVPAPRPAIVCAVDDPLKLGEIVSVGSRLPMRAVIVGRAYQWGEIRYDLEIENKIVTNVERDLITKLDGECVHIDVIDDRLVKGDMPA